MKNPKFWQVSEVQVTYRSHLQEAWLEAFTSNETEIVNKEQRQQPLEDQESILANANATIPMITRANSSKNDTEVNEMPVMNIRIVDADNITTNVTEPVPTTTPLPTTITAATTTTHISNNGTLPSNGTSTATRFLRRRRKV